MNSELKYLFNEKKLEGLSDNEAQESVNEFRQSQIDFKLLKKELKKKDTEIKNLNKEILELQKKINKTKNQNLIQGLKEYSKQEKVYKESKGATLNNVKRVIKFTEVGKFYTKTELARDLIIQTTCIDEIITFLNNHTNIKFQIEGGKYIRLE